ncbi:MAG: translation initiation factor IF-3 [Actinobacteria bacterium]|nr:translation initiation factor IF-3 [Actinomycetota bacterium]NCU80781.1 translation initiation factor IF-3 [Acidimicrobiia bacterium]NDC99281.1 translation initiation factor IF-3 [bacterium]HBQ52602.1 translation initiation factor IF-3 [Acidimicrobium sp.]NBO97310.1 translation initiation factor IF-3 [Actinomycetota bacterium]
MAPPNNEPRYNERIRAKQVRLVDADGSQVGVVSIEDALERSRKADLDLVEVAPLAEPPVCRIMDYGKFRYEEAQRLKESRKKTVQITMKEVKFKPKIAKGDFDTKVRHMLEFLDEGHKVKVTLQFRGREMAHPELGSKILDAVIEQLGPIAKVDTSARLEGRNMTMVLSPDKKAAKRPANPKPDAAKPTVIKPTTIKQDDSVTTTETETQNAKDENIQDSQKAI